MSTTIYGVLVTFPRPSLATKSPSAHLSTLTTKAYPTIRQRLKGRHRPEYIRQQMKFCNQGIGRYVHNRCLSVCLLIVIAGRKERRRSDRSGGSNTQPEYVLRRPFRRTQIPQQPHQQHTQFPPAPPRSNHKKLLSPTHTSSCSTKANENISNISSLTHSSARTPTSSAGPLEQARLKDKNKKSERCAITQTNRRTASE